MKVGILTLTPGSNYGGLLQTVALCEFVRQQGHDVFLINKKFSIKPRWKAYLVSLLQQVPGQNIRNIRGSYRKSIFLSEFLRKNVNRITAPVYGKADFIKVIRDIGIEAVIV